jgi:mannose/cellobiose epimerase-like protein (N-acyl-D-glucosamine 2-epimerase family)
VTDRITDSVSERQTAPAGATAAWLRSWLVDRALPIWAEAGFDEDFGCFHERLSQRGRPIPNLPYRLVTQARQIYVYSRAAVLGWFPAGQVLAARAIESLARLYSSPDGHAGYVASVDRSGTVSNATRETYGHAFVLLALAWWYRVTHDSRVLNDAAAALDVLDSQLATPGVAGFQTSRPGDTSVRLQDPHLHVLEAMLDWYDATGDSQFLSRASAMVDLFCERLWQPDTRTVSEYFDGNWRPLPGDDGLVFKPGHQFEWSWLLRVFSRASTRDLHEHARALYEVGRTEGVLPDGRIVDEVLPARGPRQDSTRLWPQCEWIRSSIIEHEHGHALARRDSMTALAVVRSVFCRDDLGGLWMEHVDVERNPIVDFVPATSLYHILGAAADADRAFPR